MRKKEFPRGATTPNAFHHILWMATAASRPPSLRDYFELVDGKYFCIEGSFVAAFRRERSTSAEGILPTGISDVFLVPEDHEIVRFLEAKPWLWIRDDRRTPEERKPKPSQPPPDEYLLAIFTKIIKGSE